MFNAFKLFFFHCRDVVSRKPQKVVTSIFFYVFGAYKVTITVRVVRVRFLQIMC